MLLVESMMRYLRLLRHPANTQKEKEKKIQQERKERKEREREREKLAGRGWCHLAAADSTRWFHCVADGEKKECVT